MGGFMCLSLLNLKANGVCHHLLRMGQQAVCQLLRLELQVRIKPRDDEVAASEEFFYMLACWPISNLVCGS
ncbi:hypothetical protein I3843_02G136700 [Carya illinoinensis]|nr:hypothetical protein I3843_02G136700 [Carya illinoinensis]